MFTDIAWSTFLPAALVVSLIPGANQILSIQHGARLGPRSAILGLVGRFSAFGIHVGLVAVGLSALLLRSVLAFEVIRWLGVVYLLWLGVAALRSDGSQPEQFRGSDPSPVRREFLTALTNPKALLLFAAFVPQFVAGGGAVSLAVAGLAYIAVEAVTAVLYIFVGKGLAGLFQSGIHRRRLDRATGVAYVGIASWLAFERRP